MCIHQKFRRHEFHQLLLDDIDILAGCNAGAVRDPEDMRIHCHCWHTKRGIQYNVGSFASDTGQCL